MARILAVVALLGLACATPVPTNTLPKVVLGLFEAVPGSENNFAEFAKVFRLPEGVKFEERNLVGFRKEGDTYHQRFFFPSNQKFSIDLPFKLGEKQTTTINGKNVEYEFTAEGDEHTGTFHAKFREVDGDVKFTVEAAFNDEGYNATYTRENIVAKRNYRRTLPWYVLGAYELDMTKTDANIAEFYNGFFPLPKGLTWTKDVKFFVGRHGNKFYEKFMVDPTYYEKVEFELNKQGSMTHGNTTVEYKYEVVESTPESTTMRVTYKCPEKGNLVFTCVFDRDGVTSTAKNDKTSTQVKSRFNRVLPWLYYGKFQEVPEKTENFEAFIQGSESAFDNQPYTLEMFRKGDHYGARKTFQGGKRVDFDFSLNTPQEFTFEGKTYKYNVSVQARGDKFVLHNKIKVAGTDKKFIVEETVAPEGLYVTYKRDNVVAKKFLRRIVSKTVVGTFESTDLNEEFKSFANFIEAPEFLKKLTAELTQNEDGTVNTKLTPEGDAVQESHMTFGKNEELTVYGKHLEHKVFYFEVDNTPVIRSSVNQTDNARRYFEAAAVFRPDGTGYTATFSYDHNTKIARRNFVRKGEAVPFVPVQ